MKLEVRSHEVRSKKHEVRSSNELPGFPYLNVPGMYGNKKGTPFC